MQNNRYSQLSIHGLELIVNLGVSPGEHNKAQSVLIDIDILFLKNPAACQTDRIEDTLCYHTLIKSLQTRMKDQTFHLIEFLADTIYQHIKPQLTNESKLLVKVRKFPHIEGLTEGVSFRFGDPA